MCFMVKMADGMIETMDRRFMRLDGYLADGKEYLVGKTLTLADVTIASALGHSFNKYYYKSKREKYPNCIKYYERSVWISLHCPI